MMEMRRMYGSERYITVLREVTDVWLTIVLVAVPEPIPNVKRMSDE